ncbi:phosphotriesterase family protein [Mariniradius sediminis]|uniref:Phosphotriesterase n=1 Tax=Mariniradius sediminis TaxID=2909237 RepID=A0ABS9BU01_9BACT|nr:phosphotriesterase [Mariniradius sediminis]MCF1750636.1 phosphotriesterase [Mariniradius sediminis]
MRNLILILLILFACQPKKDNGKEHIRTVSGETPASEMGMSLIHEHVLVDFIGADSTGYHRWNRAEVVARVMPFLEAAKARGVKTIVECTPAYLGRDPLLLKELSEKSGIQFLTNTGYYGAVGEKYLPKIVEEATSDELAAIWIGEAKDGIENTGIKPGFIKISVNEGSTLNALDEKLVRAAALTHQATGLLIVSHTGPWATAKAQIEILQSMNVDLGHFVWVHAQNEKDFASYDTAHDLGVWISLDGIAWDVPGHLERLRYCKEKGFLDRVLVSHDAGWYRPGEPDGGDFKGYTALFDELIPQLKSAGFTESDIDLLLVKNPRVAFSLE